MTQQHPITPPPELVNELQDLGNLDAITLAYQAGADQELEACCEWVYHSEYCQPHAVLHLRAARRPKPPSLKEQALAALNTIEDKMLGPTTEEKLIRKALEALDD